LLWRHASRVLVLLSRVDVTRRKEWTMYAPNQFPMFCQKWGCFVMVTREDIASGIAECDRILAKLARIPADLLLADDRKMIATYEASKSAILADLAEYFG